MRAPRVLIAIEPRMYAEVLAFSIGRHRPRAEVSLLGPSEDPEDALQRLRPHLVVANSVPKAAREEASFFWVEMAEARAGDEAKRLGARISADGYSRSVDDVSIAHVLAALDRAERELVLKGGASPPPDRLPSLACGAGHYGVAAFVVLSAGPTVTRSPPAVPVFLLHNTPRYGPPFADDPGPIGPERCRFSLHPGLSHRVWILPRS